MQLHHGLEEEQIIGQLRKVVVPAVRLRELHGSTEKHVFRDPRYATILREGVMGGSFHVLLQGQVLPSVQNNVTVDRRRCLRSRWRLGTEVRREATVRRSSTATCCSSSRATSTEGVELGEVRVHVIGAPGPAPTGIASCLETIMLQTG